MSEFTAAVTNILKPIHLEIRRPSPTIQCQIQIIQIFLPITKYVTVFTPVPLKALSMCLFNLLKQILAYLNAYTDHFGVRKFIRFHTKVVKAEPIRKEKGEEKGEDESTLLWRVTTQSMGNEKGEGDFETGEYDGVVVANGKLSLFSCSSYLVFSSPSLSLSLSLSLLFSLSFLCDSLLCASLSLTFSLM